MSGPYYEEGSYEAEVVQQALGKNQKGTPQFVLRVRILHQFVNGERMNVRNQYERTIYMYLTEGAAPYTIEKLESIGFAGTSFRELDPNESDHCDFRGQPVNVVCKHEPDQNGEDREKWDIARIGSGEIETTPLEPAETRKLDALFGKSLSKPAKASKLAPVQNNDAITDDDIPF